VCQTHTLLEWTGEQAVLLVFQQVCVRIFCLLSFSKTIIIVELFLTLICFRDWYNFLFSNRFLLADYRYFLFIVIEEQINNNNKKKKSIKLNNSYQKSHLDKIMYIVKTHLIFPFKLTCVYLLQKKKNMLLYV